MEIFLFIVILLIILAASDLIVGVSNDAVNFLNSSIGSKVAPRYIIMLIASLGILAGVTFSSGMMEVARKGIFFPQYFLMPEIMYIFLAVMLTDILLLDLYNTFGYPTSTTVSIVFELLGAAVAISLIKIFNSGEDYSELSKYINSGKALAIIMSILLSVVIAFVFGAVIQYISRLIFTFDYKKRLKRYGAIWCGFALAMIGYFILIKGAKGASFITPDMLKWIKSHSWLIMGMIFAVSAIIFQLLLIFTKVNILKPIVLIGTFALALAFAANDLVNFIGVPLASLSTYEIASSSANPMTLAMEALQKPVQTNTIFLLIAGIIMVVTLWLSKKARSVTETEISLGRQDEGVERFGSSVFSRNIVRMASSFFSIFPKILPSSINNIISSRFEPVEDTDHHTKAGNPPSFDLLRASVNLMVASAVVSFATSLKLPLSTTYVTFMVAMGTSLADKAWGRESAVYRVAGVLAVIGGWFFTAFMAFTVSSIFAVIIYFFELPAIIVILIITVYIIYRNHHLHKKRVSQDDEIEVFNLKKVKDADYAIQTSFHQTGLFLQVVNDSIVSCYEGLFMENRQSLKSNKTDTKKIQRWANIITANVFKTLRLLSQEKSTGAHNYSPIINSLQEIAESQRDIVMRSYTHIDNNHKGLLEDQVSELTEIKKIMDIHLNMISKALLDKKKINSKAVSENSKKLKKLIKELDKKQISRIQDDISKTRLSILYYALIGNAQKIYDHALNLLEIYTGSLKRNSK